MCSSDLLKNSQCVRSAKEKQSHQQSDQNKKPEDESTNIQDDSKMQKSIANAKHTKNRGDLYSAMSSSYVTGQQVFNRDVSVKEHNETRHIPANFLIDNNSIKKEKARPFSSVPQRNKFKQTG